MSNHKNTLYNVFERSGFMKFKSSIKRVDIQASFICVILVICSSLSIFYINYQITYNNIIETLHTRTDAIYNVVDSLLYSELFDQINSEDDFNSDIYKEYQNRLLQMREVANVRYLYTAKKNADGEYIYLIDGLPLDSEDFRKPGELIESDIIDDIARVYQGEIVLPNDILDTSWGKIFLAYYPIHGGPGHTEEIVGVVGIEIDAETQYNTYHDLLNVTPVIIITVCILAFLIFRWCFRYISNPRRKDLYNVDGLTGLKNRASLEYDYMNFYIKDKVLSVIMIDLDRLKKVNDNYGHSYGDEYIRLATEAIKKAVGKLGISYRLGGDEFVVIMNCVNRQKVETMVENIYNEFHKLTIDFLENPDLSIGFAIYDESKDSDFYDILKRADEIMYKHKKEKYMREDD